MKKHFNKELVITKGENEDFKNSKCWICDSFQQLPISKFFIRQFS